VKVVIKPVLCVAVCCNVDRYDESLWRALDLSGKSLKKDCVSQLLDRGVSVIRLAGAEVNASY